MDRRHTGRARNPEVTRDVLASALALARDLGPTITVDQIAGRAGVSKASIYRRWDTKWDLLLEALLTEARAAIDRAPDLTAFLSSTFAVLTGPQGTGPLVTALMLHAVENPEFAATWREKFVSVRRQVLMSALEREGMGADGELVTDVLYGVMWYRLLAGHAPLDDELAERLARVAHAITSVAEGTASSPPKGA